MCMRIVSNGMVMSLQLIALTCKKVCMNVISLHYTVELTLLQEIMMK